MTTVYQERLYGWFKEIKSNLRRNKVHRTDQGLNFLGGSFTNNDNIRTPVLFIEERQSQHLDRWFFFKCRPIHFHVNSSRTVRPLKRNKCSFSSTEINKPLQVIFSYCQKSDIWSHLECRVVWSAQIAMLQITSAGRSLLYCRKSVGPRMETWGTQPLTGYFWENFQSRIIQSCLLLRGEEIAPNIRPAV